MANVRSGHLVIGVGLAVMGYAVLIIALAEQAERGMVSAASNAPSAQAPAVVVPPPEPAPSAAASVAAAPAASKAVAGDDSPEALEGHLFKFSPGGAVMAREEVQRLLAFGKLVARRPAVKVAIEGFGDLPGSEPLMVGIGKHRAKVGQTLLAKAGVSEDRVSVTFADMAGDTRLARSIRITTMPPFTEGDRP